MSLLDSAPSDLRIALVGTAPSSRLLAPCHDPSWKIWACSPDNKSGLSRVDAWFELHNLGYPEYQAGLKWYVEWLRERSEAGAFDVYAQDQRFIRKAITFPKDELIGHFGCRFFTSSFAWMIAFALTKGVKELGLFGIDMSSSNEYRLQRPGIHHFLEICEASGVSITVPSESDILQPAPLYGYERNSPFVCKLETRRHELSTKLAYARAKRADAERRICMLQGAMDKSLVASVAENSPALVREKLKELQDLHKQCDYQVANLTGCRDDLDYMLTIWAGEHATMAHSNELPAALSTAPAIDFAASDDNPHDVIAVAARKAYQQVIPYQNDEPDPSLLGYSPECVAANAVGAH